MEEVQDLVLEAVQEALDDDRRDGARGGVTAEHLADYVDRAPTTIKTHILALRKRGDLVRVSGIGPDGTPRPSYLPVEHPDADPPESVDDHRPTP